MYYLKQLFEVDTKAGKYVNLTIQALILISLVDFSLDTIPNLNKSVQFWLRVNERVMVALFSIEYILRILTANRKLRYIFSFYGLIDLAAILPFFFLQRVDLRSIRILRFFSVFRILKILRYSKATHRLRLAFLEIRHELELFIITTAMLIYLASVGIYFFESNAQPDDFGSIFHCLWWAVVTLTTVGYGDAIPITIGGKIFTGLIALTGIGIVAVPTALFASALTRAREKPSHYDIHHKENK